MNDLTTATLMMDPKSTVSSLEWQAFHNVCYSNQCVGFSVANEGQGNTNMVYCTCLKSDNTTSTTNPGVATVNLGTFIINNTYTN